MKLRPINKVIIGRMVDICRTAGGLELPTSQIKNVTVFVLVESVGPGVTVCKPGDILLYRHMGHVYLRDGSHWAILEEENILCHVEDIEADRVTIEGEPPRSIVPPENGSRLVT